MIETPIVVDNALRATIEEAAAQGLGPRHFPAPAAGPKDYDCRGVRSPAEV